MAQRGAKGKAICLMVVSSLAFVLMQVVVRITSEHVSLIEQIFFRNFISTVLSLLVLRKRGLPLFGDRAHQPALIARSSLGFIGIVLLFYATEHARLADVNLFSKTSPIWATMFAMAFFQEKPSKIFVPALFMCIIGTYVAIQPSFGSEILPLVCAVGSAAITGGVQVILSYLKNRENVFTIVFHFSLFSTVVAAIGSLSSTFRASLHDILLLIFVGIFAMIGQFSMTMAVRLADVSDIAIYDYSGIVFSAFFGFLLFDESPPLSTIIGGGLIIGALLLFGFQQYIEKQDLK